jgi:predicted metal-binding membrane protein
VSSTADLTSQVFRHQRALVAVSLAALALLGWWYLLATAEHPMAGMRPIPLGALIVMWGLMMVAMMLPSAAPAILTYARVRQHRGGAAVAASWIFTAGYLAIWLLFSVAAAALQGELAGPAMSLRSPALGSAFLIGAGVYELTPLKSACLRQCRSPAEFLSRHWRPGVPGAVRLGVLHGIYCLGCCWLLMALLFVGGAMNLLWVVALAVLVGMEKIVPRGDLIGRVAGVALIAWGVARIAT